MLFIHLELQLVDARSGRSRDRSIVSDRRVSTTLPLIPLLVAIVDLDDARVSVVDVAANTGVIIGAARGLSGVATNAAISLDNCKVVSWLDGD